MVRAPLPRPHAAAIDSVRAYKERHHIGRFQEKPEAYTFAEEAKLVSVGQRCEVQLDDLAARGVVRYVGTGSPDDRDGLACGLALTHRSSRGALNDGAAAWAAWVQVLSRARTATLLASSWTSPLAEMMARTASPSERARPVRALASPVHGCPPAAALRCPPPRLASPRRSVDGERYFQTAGARRGVFVRPTLVKTGDYPELDIDEL